MPDDNRYPLGRIIMCVGAMGMMLSLLGFGFGWTAAAATFYGLLWVTRKAPGDVSGTQMAASILFWILLIGNPGALLMGFLSLFLVEAGYNAERRND